MRIKPFEKLPAYHVSFNVRNSMQNFAEILRQARQDKGLNQDELAKAMDLSQGAISQFEKGLRRPTPANIQKLSEILGVR